MNTDTVTLAMSQSHVAQIAEIEKMCFSDPWPAHIIEYQLSNPQSHFLVTLIGDTVAGYIGVHEFCDECYISNLAVPAEYRRRGIALGLLQHAESGALSRGCSFISLEVRVGNAAAISLYEKCGYKTAGMRKNYYSSPTEDALIMTKYFKD